MKHFSDIALGRDHTSSLSIRWVDGEAHLFRGESKARADPLAPFTLEMHLTRHIIKMREQLHKVTLDHDSLVLRNKTLHERQDLHVERVSCFKRVETTHAQNQELRALLQEALGKVPDRLAKQITQTLDRHAAEAGYKETEND